MTNVACHVSCEHLLSADDIASMGDVISSMKNIPFTSKLVILCSKYLFLNILILIY